MFGLRNTYIYYIYLFIHNNIYNLTTDRLIFSKTAQKIQQQQENKKKQKQIKTRKTNKTKTETKQTKNNNKKTKFRKSHPHWWRILISRPFLFNWTIKYNSQSLLTWPNWGDLRPDTVPLSFRNPRPQRTPIWTNVQINRTNDCIQVVGLYSRMDFYL